MSRHSRASGSKNQSRSNREESEQPRNEVRSNYAAISCPQNFLNPFSIFKGFMSGELKEAEQNMFPALSTFNYFKRINEVMYDKNRKVVLAYLENDPIWATTSWTEVVENFGREQAENMLECSKLIDAFGSSMEKLSKLSEQMKSTGIKTDNDARKSDFDKMRTKSEKEFPCFYLKNVIKRHNPTFIEYNTQLLNFLGYNPSEFASNLLRHGIPELYPNVQKKYASMVKEIVEILVEGKHSSKPMMKEVYLLHSNLQISLVTETIYLMRSLNKDEELEIELFMTYEKVGEPQKVEEEMEAVVKPKVAAALSETAEQEKHEFLKKFYNIKKKDDSDLARTCKIRYLSD